MELRKPAYRIPLFKITEPLGLSARQKLGNTLSVMKLTSKKLSGQHGFSLVELLVVIAVIGIIAAIAIPNIANLTGSATDAKNRRNAQNIASVASAARAAGVTNAFLKADVITSLETGVSTNGMSFSISPLAPTEQTGALIYLNDGAGANANMVLYSPTNAAP